MTTTYDHRHPAYYDEADLRGELNRVFDLCHGCRMCFNLCPSFPTLFDYADSYDGDVHQMTTAEQDHVVDECYQCKICYVKCPYIPPHEWELDFPRMIMRAEAVRMKKGDDTVAQKAAKHALGRPDLLGRLATGPQSVVVNKSLDVKPVRRLVEKAAGIASERVLPPYARQRFTTWFKKRKASSSDSTQRAERTQARAAVFPTCFVEYMQPDIGQDLVKVYERNGVACSLASTTTCCAAPLLHAGDVDGFLKVAEKNVKALAEDVRAGRDVVVPQPTCGYVLKKDYVQYVGGDDAELVARHTYDAAEYLMKLHKDADTTFDTDFAGDVPEAVTYHVPCHLQAQNIGLKSRDLMKLTGTKITLVNKCSGIDGTWGYRAENYELARKVAQPLAQAVEAAGNDVVTGDCHLANGAIVQETGKRPVHPIQFVARAYGIAEEGEGSGWGRS
ncbi:MAG: glycerol-3-phosphate dehydrogenase subunit [Acidimicrobiaceae bacterium]|nr:glycerol-3-phosphate dehydrogenase subunit [Acidimicrobiaceae bacterium]